MTQDGGVVGGAENVADGWMRSSVRVCSVRCCTAHIDEFLLDPDKVSDDVEMPLVGCDEKTRLPGLVCNIDELLLDPDKVSDDVKMPLVGCDEKT